jgi:hypothetical protein
MGWMSISSNIIFMSMKKMIGNISDPYSKPHQIFKLCSHYISQLNTEK